MSENPIILERQTLLRGLAQQAAAWWRDQVAAPGYLSKFHNGDTSHIGEIARVMASTVALKSPGPTADRLDHFEQQLVTNILARLQQDPSPVRPDYEGPARYYALSVDYAPEGELREAASAAGVAGFPWKTTMWVNWDADPAKCYLEVRCGYGAPTQRLPMLREDTPAIDC
jgi:hypothetical protein